MHYIHKYEIFQAYGGPEEGGWWYTQYAPIPETDEAYFPPLEIHHSTDSEEKAYEVCRKFNGAENRKKYQYGYTSVLSHRETFYAYTVEETLDPKEHLQGRPHYE